MERLVALQTINHSAGTIERGQAFLAHSTAVADLLATKQAVREADSPFKQWVGGLRWPGSTVVCIASGPSLTVEQCERVRAWRDGGPSRRVIVINTSYVLAPWADVLYACDATWWDFYVKEVSGTFTGELWTQDEKARKRHGIKKIVSAPGTGLGKVPGVIHQGSNSGFQVINLAWQAGAKRILLIGYDMRTARGKSHWHGNHPSTMNKALNFANWLEQFEPLAKDLAALGVAVINCTTESDLNCFPRAQLAEALR
jgi:hypothetical protein